MKQWASRAVLKTDIYDDTKEYCCHIDLLDDEFKEILRVDIPAEAIVQAFIELSKLSSQGFRDMMENVEKMSLSSERCDWRELA